MKLCPRCGKWHMQSPLPTLCESCGETLWSAATLPPQGESVVGTASEDPDAGLFKNVIDGAIRTTTHEVE